MNIVHTEHCLTISNAASLQQVNFFSYNTILQFKIKIKLSNSKFGENIYYFYSSDPSHVVHGKDAVDSWYDEIKQHTFGIEPLTTGTGHFTQGNKNLLIQFFNLNSK